MYTEKHATSLGNRSEVRISSALQSHEQPYYTHSITVDKLNPSQLIAEQLSIFQLYRKFGSIVFVRV